MRVAIIQILMQFSVLCAGLHAPVAAHDAHGGAYEAIIQSEIAFPALDQSSQDDPSDQSKPVAHHHHCPMMTAFDGSESAMLDFAKKELLWPGRATALASLASVPPTEPPTKA